jgi:hypothetical protein
VITFFNRIWTARVDQRDPKVIWRYRKALNQWIHWSATKRLSPLNKHTITWHVFESCLRGYLYCKRCAPGDMKGLLKYQTQGVYGFSGSSGTQTFDRNR